MGIMKSMFLGITTASLFAFGALPARTEEPVQPPNEPPAVAEEPLPITTEDDAGTCACQSIGGFFCSVKTNNCGSGYHPECTCPPPPLGLGPSTCACRD